LLEKAVTFEFIQLKQLMIGENGFDTPSATQPKAQTNLNRERTYFDEDNNIPLRRCLK